MASPKNWTRNNEMENQYSDLIYVWDHTKQNARVKVETVDNEYVTGKYKIVTEAAEGNPPSPERLFDNKEEARKVAVRWMEDNPSFSGRRVSGMTKNDWAHTGR